MKEQQWIEKNEERGKENEEAKKKIKKTQYFLVKQSICSNIPN